MPVSITQIKFLKATRRDRPTVPDKILRYLKEAFKLNDKITFAATNT